MESSDTLDFDDGKAPGKAIKSTRKKPYKRPACDSCKIHISSIVSTITFVLICAI